MSVSLGEQSVLNDAVCVWRFAKPPQCYLSETSGIVLRVKVLLNEFPFSELCAQFFLCLKYVSP